ncbi:hypothetical protein F4693_000892 [Sphingomonas endophytica]|uniref:Uncharacterized protein n=1 Tax=Sphingomonas endophytica TaxID=869719 RepID=A0A7X0JB18_9SPHN|nr:hypothetical protein [Sphingomonas endophytica]MBB6503934.1 hypothetical protein [Sphingomonas endophytica]
MHTIITAAAIAMAAAATAAEAGDYGPALRRMLTETAGGRCPDDLMAEPLLSACRAQLPQMQPGLSALGTVGDLSFIKGEGDGDTRVETYAVKFAGGKTAIWSIGHRKNGKYGAAYSLGE